MEITCLDENLMLSRKARPKYIYKTTDCMVITRNLFSLNGIIEYTVAKCSYKFTFAENMH